MAVRSPMLQKEAAGKMLPESPKSRLWTATEWSPPHAADLRDRKTFFGSVPQMRRSQWVDLPLDLAEHPKSGSDALRMSQNIPAAPPPPRKPVRPVAWRPGAWALGRDFGPAPMAGLDDSVLRCRVAALRQGVEAARRDVDAFKYEILVDPIAYRGFIHEAQLNLEKELAIATAELERRMVKQRHQHEQADRRRRRTATDDALPAAVSASSAQAPDRSSAVATGGRRRPRQLDMASSASPSGSPSLSPSGWDASKGIPSPARSEGTSRTTAMRRHGASSASAASPVGASSGIMNGGLIIVADTRQLGNQHVPSQPLHNSFSAPSILEQQRSPKDGDVSPVHISTVRSNKTVRLADFAVRSPSHHPP
eukprot:gnl/TRDRNA2_/TRDRNA2_193639_c0_seq1.p1 gnl/TRDRNA2_/TRDRNA2_193639_c0~~gnl/TRDRNA2_/TRDRNA2_193639_c0_seq1.p1  ORF type:complete len:366 (+),score=49.51 gnl/TRDRNA2_/TRDRNA2_193639_c0_seq1:108-1205(+)